MLFTREPIIETVITARSGYKLVVRSSKLAQEEILVDAIEIVSFGQALFYRCSERPKAFLVPVGDYEVGEVRETRLVLRHLAQNEPKHESPRESRSENRSERPEPSRRSKEQRVERTPTPVAVQHASEESSSESKEDENSPIKGDKRRERRRQRRRRGDSSSSDEPSVESTSVEAKESSREPVEETAPSVESTQERPARTHNRRSSRASDITLRSSDSDEIREPAAVGEVNSSSAPTQVAGRRKQNSRNPMQLVNALIPPPTTLISDFFRYERIDNEAVRQVVQAADSKAPESVKSARTDFMGTLGSYNEGDNDGDRKNHNEQE